jgi:hypothetical protein
MMRDCADGQMRDLLPGHVNKTLSAADRAAVEAHLATCGDCAAEIAVIEAAARAFPAPQINIAGIVGALPAAPHRASRFSGAAWRVAAGIGVVLIGAASVVLLRGFGASALVQTAAAPAPAPAGAALASTESAPAPAVAIPARASRPAASSTHAAATMSFGGGLSDLSDEQLDALMSELDTLDSIPSAEPETHLTPIVPMTPLTPPADGGHHAQ